MALSPAAYYAHPVHKIATEENRSRDSKDSALPPMPAFDSIESTYEKTPCQEGHDNRWSDLCAQWKAADAAESSALWTLVGVGIGGIGLIGVGLTVYYAREASEAATESADAAKEQLALAGRTWVLFADCLFQRRGNDIHVIVRIQNFGAIPAVVIKSRDNMFMPDENASVVKDWFFDVEKFRDINAVIVPGQQFQIAAYIIPLPISVKFHRDSIIMPIGIDFSYISVQNNVTGATTVCISVQFLDDPAAVTDAKQIGALNVRPYGAYARAT